MFYYCRAFAQAAEVYSILIMIPLVGNILVVAIAIFELDLVTISEFLFRLEFHLVTFVLILIF